MKKKILNIREIQNASLEILKCIGTFCDTHDIFYVLTYGTLLGAVRHKGFIPWDDDIDIMMPRPDYDRFVNLFCRENRYSHLVLFNQGTNKKYPYGITRVCDMKYRIHTVNEKDCGMGLFVDIYPLDGLGMSYEEGLRLMEKSHAICDKILLLTRKKLYCPQLPNMEKQIEYISNKIRYMVRGKKYYFDQLNSIVMQNKYEDSLFVGCAIWTFDPIKEIYNRALFKERIKVQFEDSSFYIPKAYDDILKITYGNYMELPPLEQRVYHHGYVAYVKS